MSMSNNFKPRLTRNSNRDNTEDTREISEAELASISSQEDFLPDPHLSSSESDAAEFEDSVSDLEMAPTDLKCKSGCKVTATDMICALHFNIDTCGFEGCEDPRILYDSGKCGSRHSPGKDKDPIQKLADLLTKTDGSTARAMTNTGPPAFPVNRKDLKGWLTKVERYRSLAKVSYADMANIVLQHLPETNPHARSLELLSTTTDFSATEGENKDSGWVSFKEKVTDLFIEEEAVEDIRAARALNERKRRAGETHQAFARDYEVLRQEYRERGAYLNDWTSTCQYLDAAGLEPMDMRAVVLDLHAMMKETNQDGTLKYSKQSVKEEHFFKKAVASVKSLASITMLDQAKKGKNNTYNVEDNPEEEDEGESEASGGTAFVTNNTSTRGRGRGAKRGRGGRGGAGAGAVHKQKAKSTPKPAGGKKDTRAVNGFFEDGSYKRCFNCSKGCTASACPVAACPHHSDPAWKEWPCECPCSKHTAFKCPHPRPEKKAETKKKEETELGCPVVGDTHKQDWMAAMGNLGIQLPPASAENTDFHFIVIDNDTNCARLGRGDSKVESVHSNAVDPLCPGKIAGTQDTQGELQSPVPPPSPQSGLGDTSKREKEICNQLKELISSDSSVRPHQVQPDDLASLTVIKGAGDASRQRDSTSNDTTAVTGPLEEVVVRRESGTTRDFIGSVN